MNHVPIHDHKTSINYSWSMLKEQWRVSWPHKLFIEGSINSGHRLTYLPLDKGAAILADDIFICIFLSEHVGISLNISLKFVPTFRINNIPALVQIMV